MIEIYWLLMKIAEIAEIAEVAEIIAEIAEIAEIRFRFVGWIVCVLVTYEVSDDLES